MNINCETFNELMGVVERLLHRSIQFEAHIKTEEGRYYVTLTGGY